MVTITFPKSKQEFSIEKMIEPDMVMSLTKSPTGPHDLTGFGRQERSKWRLSSKQDTTKS